MNAFLKALDTLRDNIRVQSIPDSEMDELLELSDKVEALHNIDRKKRKNRNK